MSISPDLMYAILSMDAYNQGYAPGIAGIGSTIGTATVQYDSLILNADPNDPNRVDQNAGFYAVAYEWNGETIISYRGTDNPDPFLFAAGASDLWNGWISGGGLPAGQSDLAFEFYEAVTGADAFDGIAQNITLTGHSLGGGLAG